MTKHRCFGVAPLLIRIALAAGGLAGAGAHAGAAPGDSLQVMAGQQQIEALQRAILAAQDENRQFRGQGAVVLEDIAVIATSSDSLSAPAPLETLHQTLSALQAEKTALVSGPAQTAAVVDSQAIAAYDQERIALEQAILAAQQENRGLKPDFADSLPADEPARHIAQLEQLLRNLQEDNRRLLAHPEAAHDPADSLRTGDRQRNLLEQAIEAARLENGQLKLHPVPSNSLSADPNIRHLQQLEQVLRNIEDENQRLKSDSTP